MASADPSAAAVVASGKRNIRHPIGRTGLQNTSGYIRSEFLRELVGRRGRKVYEEMSLNDATCGAVIFAIVGQMKSLKWSVVPADVEDGRHDEARRYAELLEGMLFEDMSQSWTQYIEDASTMFVYGFSVLEVVWKQRKGHKPGNKSQSSDYTDGLWAPAKIAGRSQKTIERWIYGESEEIVGFVQFPHDGPQIEVPMNRCVHFRTTSALDNPEGSSILRSSYRSWYFLKRLQEIEGIGTERELAGYPVLRVPGDMLDPSADSDMKSARSMYESFLQSIRRDTQEGALLPSDRDDNGNLHYELELLSSGGSRQIDTNESISRYQRDIARAVLADFLFLGDTTGSRSLGDTKVKYFVSAMAGYSRHIAEQTNDSIVRKIWRMNGLDFALMPEIVPQELKTEDLKELADFVNSLASVGYLVGADEGLEENLRRRADLPPKSQSVKDLEQGIGEVGAELTPDRDQAEAGTADEDEVGETLKRELGLDAVARNSDGEVDTGGFMADILRGFDGG